MISLVQTLNRDKISIMQLMRKAKDNRYYGWQNYETLEYSTEQHVRLSLIVENVLFGLPLPYLAGLQQNNGAIEFVTNTHILTALISFIENKFPLLGTRIGMEYSNKRFSDIAPILQSRLEDCEISFYYLLESKIGTPVKDLFINMMEQKL